MPSIKLLPFTLLFASVLATPLAILDSNDSLKDLFEQCNKDTTTTTPVSCIIKGVDFSCIAQELIEDAILLTSSCPLDLDTQQFTELLHLCCDDMEGSHSMSGSGDSGEDNDDVCALQSIPVNSTNPAVPASFDNVYWIWTQELNATTGGPGAGVPPGGRPFRRTVRLPFGHVAERAEALITTDNAYSLYLNGEFIGTGTYWPNAQRFNVTLPRPHNKVVVAVYGENYDDGNSPAGVLASLKIYSRDLFCKDNCEYVTSVITDSCWKTESVPPPDGFQFVNYTDTTWDSAYTQYVYQGGGPWGSLNVPASFTPVPNGTPLGN
ncbi:hypothetical protein D9758_013328 [Tetrapyrgos nigripes]|uniref:Uncharacterized protein n=1 Tax=Tetrapyrgos nigripes TaxID=182062 RepID=A0A8H5CD28_9AGAR|nr:hypothetical protein D9758_013328 [Tetrapyrgos nigripes]